MYGYRRRRRVEHPWTKIFRLLPPEIRRLIYGILAIPDYTYEPPGDDICPQEAGSQTDKMYESWKNVKDFLHSSQEIEKEFDDFLCTGGFQLRIDFSGDDASLNYEAMTIRQLDLNSKNLIFEPSIRRLVIRIRYYGNGDVNDHLPEFSQHIRKLALRLAQLPQDFEYLKIILTNLDESFLDPFNILRRVGKFEFAERGVPNSYYTEPFDYEAISDRRFLEKVQIEGKTSNTLYMSLAKHAESTIRYAQSLDHNISSSEANLSSIFPDPSIPISRKEEHLRTSVQFEDTQKAERQRLILDPRQELSYHAENAIRFETLNPSFVDGCTPCSPDRMESREALWGNILQQVGVGEGHCPSGSALVQMVEELLDMPQCGHMYSLDKDWKSILRSNSGQGPECV